MLEIVAHEIRGNCPVYKIGDKIMINDPVHAYMQCVDPSKPYTKGGTVIFKCRKITSHETEER